MTNSPTFFRRCTIVITVLLINSFEIISNSTKTGRVRHLPGAPFVFRAFDDGDYFVV